MSKFKAQYIFRIVQGLVLVMIGPFVPATGPAFFVIVLISIFASLLLKHVLKIKKSEMSRRMSIRRDIMKRKPAEGWIALALGVVLPVFLGVFLYFMFGFSYESVAIIFIGVSYLGSGVAEARLEPEVLAVTNAVFD